MTSFIKLKNTPIKEIIFTISFIENVDFDKLDAFKALPEISKNFNIVNKGFNTHVEAKGQEQPTARILQDGYVLRCNPLSRIIQARKGSFSFHKINGYERFEILIAELEQYWNLFIQCNGMPLTVNNLSARYLNFIERKSEEKIDDLITIHSIHPFGDTIENSFIQYKFKYDRNPDIVANVITAKGKDKLKEGVVLDIILNKKINSEQNSKVIFSSFNDMRVAKNDLFFRSITESTLNKYNQ